ncbi:hypothetical protein RU97_GL000144 [Enterococcus canis]|uniref:DUF2187 domain-containing protein n=1 Tax=Enterococcus canis TaxID=214095 RepID=A0A1L8RJF6_9ENTE|nr:hypothetical protein [Enterococcus canis]OJG19911.1 hypothetical protein RU97_GL000144 [Enterococcus canis]
METKTVSFSWEDQEYQGIIEKEYENAYLLEVIAPSDEMYEKFTNRMIVSKKECRAS